jgi:ankyrin repeat protein
MRLLLSTLRGWGAAVKSFRGLLIGVCLFAMPVAVHAADTKRDALWAAVRAGDVKAINKAIEDGADVNARNEYGVSALWIAAGKGKLEVVKALVDRGADVNSRDDIWYQTPLSQAVAGQQLELSRFLLEAGARDVDAALLTAASGGSTTLSQAILNTSKVSQDAKDAALYSVSSGSNKKLREALGKRGQNR